MRKLLFVVGFAAACSAREEPSWSPSPPRPSNDATPSRDAALAIDAAAPWFERFDFDGDGQRDHVEAEYTGGAHCCYRFSVQLTIGKKISLPFLMDGGYAGPDLLSNPQQLSIRVDETGVAEMRIEIETYNGEPQPLKPEWSRRWGFSSHRVIISFRGGALTIRDQ